MEFPNSKLTSYIYANTQHYEKSGIFYMFRKHKINATYDINENHDFGFFWDPLLKLKKNTGKMVNYIKKNNRTLINQKIKGTSKEYIGKVFNKIFNYTLRVDPLTYHGTAIVKKNGNGTKFGEILDLPINENEVLQNHTYQKLILSNSSKNKNIFYEIRVPIFGNIIPCIFYKTRREDKRFESKNIKVEILRTDEILSQEELHQIVYYCKYINLDYGEIDILRNNEDGKIYIIDVNNTPWWPCNKLTGTDRNIALNMFWNAFLEYFFPEKYTQYHIPDDKIDDYKKKKEPKIIPYNEYKYVGYIDEDFDYNLIPEKKKKTEKTEKQKKQKKRKNQKNRKKQKKQ